MDKVTLGRTGLAVGVAGLGCGGHSLLGQGYGATFDQSVAVVRAAIDLGIDFIDTAAVYGTESIVGQGIAGRRDSVVISTKQLIVPRGASALGNQFVTGKQYARAFEDSLVRLGTDYVDILHLHGVMPSQYDYCIDELVPVLLRLRDQGKIRFLGLTERFIFDPQHRMLERALGDDCWDVVMVGFNLVNQSARERFLAPAIDRNIGVLNMFAVRRALSDPQALAAMIADLTGQGLVDAAKIDRRDPLGFLIDEGGAASVIDGAYRFCRHEPGTHVILTGTGNVDHLKENIASITAPPLAPPCLNRLTDLFRGIDSVSGE